MEWLSKKEVDQIKDEIDRIATTTQFNHKNLLDGTNGVIVSTDRATTKVYIGSGVSMVNPRKGLSTGADNYQLEITANPGQTQIQLSNIFKTRSDGTIAKLDTKLRDIEQFWTTAVYFSSITPNP